jgi:glycosyltransferase involved in cell wall biosynthesis
VPRNRVEQLYREADVFLFPSFREPTGGVIIEAMRQGLPVITTDVGGPGHIVTDECGIRVSPRDPAQFATDLAGAIRRLAGDRAALQALSDGARARVADIGLWDGKIDRMIGLYESVIASSRAAR